MAQDPSAILDLESTTRGLLTSRMTTTKKNTIVAHTQSLMVYYTDTKCYWYYKDSTWNELGAGGASPWLSHVNGVYFNAGGVGIGALPSAQGLKINGGFSFANAGNRSIYMPAWSPGNSNKVIAAVITRTNITLHR